MSDAEAVGSVGEEAWKLLRALADPAPADPASAGDADPGAAGSHTCPHGWCPVCQIAGYVQDHPEALARVGSSAAALLQSVRDLMTGPEAPR